MSAAHAAVLGKADPAVRKELPRFNLISGGLNQLAKLPALLLVNGCLQILNLRCVLAHKDDQSNIGDSRRPEITNQLGITHSLGRVPICALVYWYQTSCLKLA